MALSNPIGRASGGVDEAPGSPYTISSITIGGGTDNAVFLVVTSGWGAAGLVNPTLSMDGGVGAPDATVVDRVDNSQSIVVAVWRNVSGGTYAITITDTQLADTNIAWSVHEFTGADQTTTTENLQQEDGLDAGEDGDLTITSSTGDVVMAVFVAVSDPTYGDTLVHEVDYGYSSHNLLVTYAAGAASVTMDFAGYSGGYNMVAYNVIAASSGVTGTISRTLPAITISASGTNVNNPTGTISEPLPMITVVSTGTNVNNPTGTISEPLPMLLVSATGTNVNNPTGTITRTLPMITVSADGSYEIKGDIAENLPMITIVASGESTAPGGVVGTIDEALPAITISSTGTHVSNPTGTISKTLPAITISATGISANNPIGSIVRNFPLITVSAAGTFTGPLQAVTTTNGSGVATFEFTLPAGALTGEQFTLEFVDEDSLTDQITLTVP